MSEQQPLLSSSYRYEHGMAIKTTIQKWRERTAKFLTSLLLHKIIVTLIVIDVICVLIDLGYTNVHPGCRGENEDEMPRWLSVLAHVSLAITTVFLVEIPLTLWSLGFQYMNPFGPVPYATLHLFDSVIIVTTFIFEAVLHGKEREFAGLLVILRLWRLIKLVGGVAVASGELGEELAEELAKTKKDLERTTEELAASREEIRGLRQRLIALNSESPV